MQAKQSRDFFIWRHFLHNPSGTVIVLPSPHGEYKSGISYSDACAMGEIYARLQQLTTVDVRTPELLGDDRSQNLILIAGKKANPVTRDFQSSLNAGLSFDLEDGMIYDREKQIVVTTQYAKGEKRTLDHVTTDYGLITYTKNPYGQSTKVLQLAGIKGCGTLAAAIAVNEESSIHEIEELLKQRTEVNAAELENNTLEILVKVCASHGKAKRDSLSLEKLKVGDSKTGWIWESEEYRQLDRIIPHRLCVTLTQKANPDISVMKVRIDDQEIHFAKSPDRLRLLYLLAEQAREDYYNGSENAGGVKAKDLAEKLWHIKLQGGVMEIPAEVRREISGAILTWARHLQNQGKLRVGEEIKLSHHYIDSEILAFDFDVKKKIADLVYLINQEERRRFGPTFQLIEFRPGLGYRLNLHPALISITQAEPGD